MSHFTRLFKPQFAPLVESGAKLQTVRPTPIRMPAPGDTISLRTWEGAPYRSKQRVLREATITEVGTVEIYRRDDKVPILRIGGLWTDPDQFAALDGFDSWDAMVAWFEKEHGLPFAGIVIRWANATADQTGRGEL